MKDWAKNKAEAEMMKGTSHIMKMARIKSSIKKGDIISTNTAIGKMEGRVTRIDQSGYGVYIDVGTDDEMIEEWVYYEDVIIVNLFD